MRTTTQIIEHLNNATKDLLETIQEFPAKSFNVHPGKDRWSAGDVGQHLLKTELCTLQILNGEVTEANRDPEDNIMKIETQFLNFNKKFAAFGPIIPDDSPKEQAEMVDKLTRARQWLAEIVVELDLEKLCKGFGHPIFGDLTRVEWIYFTIIHGKRHIQQMDGIREEITTSR